MLCAGLDFVTPKRRENFGRPVFNEGAQRVAEQPRLWDKYIVRRSLGGLGLVAGRTFYTTKGVGTFSGKVEWNSRILKPEFHGLRRCAIIMPMVLIIGFAFLAWDLSMQADMETRADRPRAARRDAERESGRVVRFLRPPNGLCLRSPAGPREPGPGYRPCTVKVNMEPYQVVKLQSGVYCETPKR